MTGKSNLGACSFSKFTYLGNLGVGVGMEGVDTDNRADAGFPYGVDVVDQVV